MARITKRRASGARASSWDKISARGLGETMANRDVHEDQQLDRGTIAGKKTKTPRMIATVLIGLVVFVVAWIACSMITMAVTSLSSGLTGLGSSSGHSYYQRDTRSGPNGVPRTCYRPVSSANNPIGTRCYARVSQVPVPRWYRAQQHRRARETKAGKPGRHDDRPANTLASNLGSVSPLKLIVSLTPAALTMLLLGSWLSKRVDSANLMHDTSDVNQYPDDQHIALPEEIQRTFDWFPDAGAHSSVQANSMISHMMLTNKKLKKVGVTKRAETDIHDADGDLEYYRGEAIVDENGDPVTTMQPMIDEEFSEALFDASGLPKDKSLRKKYDTTVIPYNPGDASRDKLTGYATVADLINGDWTFPGYEVQRPGGAYIVDTAPVNTMVLAITRAGKGQTYIEPMIDMWLREKNPSNMVINDPKGELLVKNYIAAVTRGFEVVQFNLINPMKTDIYNLLGMAAEAAREGDATKCAMYVDNIANVFFPVDGGEDPVWPNAAQNAFKQVAYGLIDHYLEEERELRDTAAATGMDPEVLDTRLNDMWGKVTLYNCYQFFVQLTAKKLKNPVEELGARVKAGEFGDPDGEGFQREAFEAEKARAERRAFLWEDKPDADMLTLYFNATRALPRNTVRTLVGNANNALRAMAGAEKMLASVYGIAITAMSFFTDPTISTLTSGTPNQNVDLAGLSFPRRLGVRFAQNYLNRDHLVGLQCVWSAYGDAMFTDDLGEDFGHTDIIGREGWARYNFKGIFPADEAWLKLELRNPATNMLVRTFYFQFKKGYQTSLNGRHYVTETVTGRKIVKNGVLRELRPVTDAGGQIVSYKPRDTLFPAAKLVNLSSGVPEKAKTEARAITQTLVRYSESPKAVFLVTPPHLMSYAKLILILVKQLVDVSFDQSYMTKSNQKPLYRTRFMLDELGNLQSDGHGISGFETMLSIGLGQEQQFTLILQTLQQLRDVYGESVDKIVQGNTSNIVFLKSTDDTMIETLEKMSGKTHQTYADSKSVTVDKEKLGQQVSGQVSYTFKTDERAVISYNNMAFIPERNSIVFRAGDAPVWNRNATILPMSFKLLGGNTIVHPGHEYDLQTLPTLSSALDFDVRRNQPDFVKMLDKRMRQAVCAQDAKDLYKGAYQYADFDVAQLDPDTYADEVMEIISVMSTGEAARDPNAPQVLDADDDQAPMMIDDQAFIENVEVQKETQDLAAQKAMLEKQIYAEGLISRSMLLLMDGTTVNPSALHKEIVEAYKRCRTDLERDGQHFSVGGDGELRSADGTTTYITTVHSKSFQESVAWLNQAATEENARVFSEGELSEDGLSDIATVKVHADFYRFLVSLPTWEHLADGEFDRAMAVEMRNNS